jgi:DNA repair exonuclease SbcCD ATPase subunit
MVQLSKKLSQKIQTQQESIRFYSEHDVCPTCSQGLDDTFKTTAVHTHEHSIVEIEDAIKNLSAQLTELETEIETIISIENAIADHKEKIIEFNTSIIGNQNYIKKLQEEIQIESNNTSNLEDEKTNLKTLAKEVVALAEEKGKLTEDKHYHEIAGILLRDTGIKTKIIKQYLPVINKLVNKYLTAMDFFCHFELDETFNETIKSRHRDDFSYASFSEGEKQRIDLALLFTWRTIAKMKNCASTNLLLLDEVFDSSLDANGTDYVMNLINTLGDETNVFVISHKGDLLFDKFRSVIKFEKIQNFSRIQGN